MSTKMLLLLSFLSFQRASARPRCGGIFTGTRGVIQTPDFPGPFPMPIDCEWVIDAQHMLPKNTTIVVYLTQLFVFEGLKFTEYQIYDDGFQYNGRDLLVVNETNVVTERTVETNQSFLVISLKLTDIEGTHLRLLDHYLNVFGFNVTYEMTEGAPRSGRCNMMDCGFNGDCFDNFVDFQCVCKGNFTGKYCSEGSSSICEKNKNSLCQNGGTCRHVGASAVKCICPGGYTGASCEVAISPGSGDEADKARLKTVSCTFSGKQGDVCNCSIKNDFSGYLLSMHLGNLPQLKNAEMDEYIRNQVMQKFKTEVPNINSIIIDEVRINMAGADVVLRIYYEKKDGEALKSVFTRWSARRFISNLTVLDEDINSGPILSTASLSVNKPGTIRLHEDFVLSCAARGSSGMTFRWMKDGVFIKTSHSGGRKWNRIIKDPHVEDQYTALLGVSDADAVDDGVFTCQVEDFGYQRCMSKRIHIGRAPPIRIDPMSLTVRKGERFAIKCICAEDNSQNRRTYSWTRNRELLPVRTDWGSYEVLYPDGSILEVHKAEKSATYSCLVQDGSLSSEASVEVLVIAAIEMKTCETGDHYGVSWPATAPDSESKRPCPPGFSGTAIRRCVFSSEGPAWRTPDFSQCLSTELLEVTSGFQAYRLGYETSYGPSEILDDISNRLRLKALLPGEGARLLSLVRSVISTINSRFDLSNGDEVFFDIIERLMGQKMALINGEQVELLQRVIKEMALFHFSQHVNGTLGAFHRSSEAIDVSLKEVESTRSSFLRFPLAGKSYPKWFSYKLEVSVELGDCTPILASVVYRNLSSFLPPRSAIRLEDGTEIEYVLASEIVAVWLYDTLKNEEIEPLRGVTMSMKIQNHPRNSSSGHWETRCAVGDFAMFENSWDISSCSTEELNDTHTRCFCRKPGTYAVILANKPQRSFGEKLEIHKFVVTLGCTICFVLSTASGIVLLAQWSQNRTCLLFVKLQCCFSISGAMIVFIVALATENNHSASLSMALMVLLETFLLIAASTQLSKLLVVYAEFVQIPRPGRAKMTVIGVITGVPLITVFGNHTAHRTMNIKLRTWWIVTNSLSFYVFMTCFIIIILLYVFVFVVVGSKLHQYSKFHQKNIGCLRQRKYLLNRSALIFGFIITTTLSSIAYVNHSSQVYWNYEFCIITISLGLVIVFSYVLKKDNTSYPDILDKLKKKDKEMIIANSKNDHLTFYTKEDAEAESESTPESKYTPKTTKVRFAPEPQFDLIEHPPEVTTFDVLETYRCSPKSFRKDSSDSAIRKNSESECLELDLVISFKQEEQKKVNLVRPRIAITSCDEGVSDAREKMEFTTFQKNTEVKRDVTDEKKSELDVVLTSISQDLDYLLNQEEDLMDTLKRKRLKSAKEVKERESGNRKYPEAIADISRTKC